MFGSLYAWDLTRSRITDLSADDSVDGLLGLDQMGHFGPQGCDLVVAELRTTNRSGIRLCELGAGFGGSLRHMVHRLRGEGVAVDGAVGVELVGEHCALARRITRSLGCDPVVVQADAGRLPLRPGGLDAVVATGSVPHFPHMAAVLREAARALRPGGLLVFTEEVSLVADDVKALPDDFLALHPPGVFFWDTVAGRDTQLHAAGLTKIRHRPLTSWATELVEARLKALDLFRGTAERIFGVEGLERIGSSLRVTGRLYASRILVPRLTVAENPS